MHVSRGLKTAVLALALGFVALAGVTLYVLRDHNRRLRKAEAELARLAAASPLADEPPSRVHLQIPPDAHSLGRAEAPVTVVEFTDLECPFCRQFHRTTFADLQRAYVDSGRVRWVSLDLPLDIHALAFKAAEATWCAGDQSRYWPMRNALLSDTTELTMAHILTIAQAQRVNVDAFAACIDAGRHRAEVQRDAGAAASLRITHTPTFVVGRSVGGTIDGVVIQGAQPYRTFQTTIDSVLGGR